MKFSEFNLAITDIETTGLSEIDHEIIENYIHDDDQDLIDKLIIDKSHEWYRQEGISELLQFENMNLGSLLELEIAPYFLQIIKNFIGVKRVIDKENKRSVFYVAGLSEHSTTGAGFYLLTEWSRLCKKFGYETPFLVMLRFEPGNLENWTLVFEK